MAKKKLSSVVGIDIGSQFIKVAEIRSTGRDVSVTALGMAPTPEGMVDHNGVYDTEAIGAVIKELCASSGVSQGFGVFSLAGQAAILVRTLEVPRMNPAELKQHMEWEISRNQPFAELTVQSDYKEFPVEDQAAQNMDVVMAIGAQSAVETLMGIAKKCGKVAHALDVEPLAIARVLSTCYGVDLANNTVCVVEVGAKSTSINMYRDGKLLLPRQVPVGGDALTQAIAGAKGISNEDAEALKVSKGEIPSTAGAASFGGAMDPFAGDNTQAFAQFNPFADEFAAPMPTAEPSDAPGGSAYGYNPFGEPGADAPAPVDPYAMPADQAVPADPYAMPTEYAPFDAEPPAAAADAPPAPPADPVSSAPALSDDSMELYNAMAREVDEFLAEVRRSIDYYRSKGGDVNRILLGGGGAKLKGLGPFIERVLGIPVEMIDPLRGLPLNGKRLDMGMIDAHRPDFLIAVGNAMHVIFD